MEVAMGCHYHLFLKQLLQTEVAALPIDCKVPSLHKLITYGECQV